MRQRMSLRLELMPPSGILPGVRRAAEAYWNVTDNPFGRSPEEAIADFASIIKSLEAPRNVPTPVTPLLVSDTETSPPSSPSNWSPLSDTHGPSRDMSPFLSPTGPMMLKRPPMPMNYMEMQGENQCRSASQVLYPQSDPSRDGGRILVDYSSEAVIEVISPSPPARFLSAEAPEYSARAVNEVQPADVLRALVLLHAKIRPVSIPVQPEISVPIAPEPPVEDYEAQKETTVSFSTSVSYHSSPSPSLPPSPVKKKRKRKSKLVGPFVCPHCPQKTFTRNFDMKRHMKSVHDKDGAQARTCPCCHEVLSRDDAFNRHCRKVPGSCLRHSQLLRKSPPPELPESHYKSVREKAEKIYKTRQKAAEKAEM